MNVYANSPQMTLALSTRNLNVSYGSASSPVGLQIVSKSGLAGTVTLSCTGLPVGMTCNFNPAQTTITAGGTATSSLTISASAVNAAGMPWSSSAAGMLLFPLAMFSLWRVRKNARVIGASLCLTLLAVVSIGGLVGCGGGTKNQPAGQQTILVNAAAENFTVSVPVVLTAQ